MRQPIRVVAAAARRAAPALALYAGIRAVGVLALGLWGARLGKSVLFELSARFDSAFYLQIAQHGYDHAERIQSDMAFFPLYPMAIRALDAVSPFSPGVNGLAVAWLGGLLAAWGIYALGNRMAGPRTGLFLVALWAALPHGLVESMAYTEAPFTALVVWSLYALIAKRWLTAGILCLFAGLTRPSGLMLAAVVGGAAVVEVIRLRGRTWRPWLGAVLAPLGFAGYITFVAIRTGRWDGWWHIQSAGWLSDFDGGAFTARTAARVLAAPSTLDFYMVTLVLVLSVMMLVIGALQRQRPELWFFSALLVVTTLGQSGYYNSKGRFLIPAVWLLLPAAQALARARTSIAITVMTTVVLVSAYFGGYLLLVWPWSP